MKKKKKEESKLNICTNAAVFLLFWKTEDEGLMECDQTVGQMKEVTDH